MEINLIMEYVSYLLTAVGVMAFLVSVITQVIKAWPGLEKLPTSAVVILLALILCPSSMAALCQWREIKLTGYMIFGCVVASFLVALVAMGGWEKVSDLWKRTRYKEKSGY